MDNEVAVETTARKNKPERAWQKKKLGNCLLKAGLIDNATLAQALEKQKSQKRKIGDILIGMKVTDDVSIAKAIADQLCLKFLRLQHTNISNKIIDLVPKNVAEAHLVMPISLVGRKLQVAMVDPLETHIIDDLRFATQMNLDIVVSPESDIKAAINQYYGNDGLDEHLSGISEMDSFLEVVEEEEEEHDEEDLKNLLGLTEQAPVVKFTNHILAKAIRFSASDIHIEPRAHDTMIRYRVDGIMREIMKTGKKSHVSVVARIKILSNMDISVRRKPQDGRTKIRVGNKEYDLRVSTIPSSFGEKVVIRLLDPRGVRLRLDDLGLSRKNLVDIKKIIHQPQGIVLATGPTGSGKSTTLFACLNEVNTPEVNIVTVEDPIEFNIKGVCQVQVNPKAGITFASGLRSILRQDPDIIMLGEIRDKETAGISFQASQTGHLVLSTLHTNDAPSAVIRLIDMGVEPYVIASGLSCVIGQRLVRKLCKHCTIKDPESEEKKKLFGAEIRQDDRSYFWISKGCIECNDFGFKGRLGLYEVLLITPSIQEVISENQPTSRIRLTAMNEGFQLLAKDGLRKALQGLTTFDELSRVALLDSIGPASTQ